ncbi:CDP-diacylglycerol--glycerol-3-phosphate 3-phosphatidyltransferase [Gemmatimonas aurantiaca]|nr:CDP-diacylglycerol--glycerol-3-phosphate 3-phosphatidyltransferase [Gemmatimonas aurantiaca]
MTDSLADCTFAPAMNTPNKLTLLRILLSPIFVALFLYENFYSRLAALFVFLIAAATDIADGYYARKYGIITGFGKFIDPLADKVLVSSAFISFVALGYAQVWMVAVIIGREFLITGLRSLAAYRGTVISPTYWAKVKTALQMSSVGAILLFINLESVYEYLGEPFSDETRATALLSFDYLLGVTAVVTALTGVDYLVRYYSILKSALK